MAIKKCSSLKIMDMDTGEILPDLPIIKIADRRSKEKSWMKLYQKDSLLSLIKNQSITGVDYRILLYLMYLMDYENVVSVTQQYIAKELEIAQPQVSKSIKKLEESSLLKRAKIQGKTVFLINQFLVKKGRKENFDNKKKIFSNTTPKKKKPLSPEIISFDEVKSIEFHSLVVKNNPFTLILKDETQKRGEDVF